MKETDVREGSAWRARQGRGLIQSGILLFLLGLLNGFFVHAAAFPLLARSAHLVALMSGIWLTALGAAWPMLGIARFASGIAFVLALYSAFLGWFAYLLAAFWGAGGMFPLASGSFKGTPTEERIIHGGLTTVAVAFITLCVMLLVGLRNFRTHDRKRNGHAVRGEHQGSRQSQTS